MNCITITSPKYCIILQLLKSILIFIHENVTTHHDKQTGTIHLKCASCDIIDSVKNQVRGDVCFYQQNDMSHDITLRQSNRSTGDNLYFTVNFIFIKFINSRFLLSYWRPSGRNILSAMLNRCSMGLEH